MSYRKDSNDIRNANDIYGKDLLCFKSIFAYLLQHLDPIFSDMSIEEIIEECLDPYNPNPYFMTPLSESSHQPEQNECATCS